MKDFEPHKFNEPGRALWSSDFRMLIPRGSTEHGEYAVWEAREYRKKSTGGTLYEGA